MCVELANRIHDRLERETKTVALVDSDRKFRAIWSELLESLGFIVCPSEDGIDIVGLNKEERFDLVILSWSLPVAASVVDGLAEAGKPYPRLIVVCSGDATQSFHLGIAPEAFLFRPFGTEEALNAVLKAIGD